MKQRGEVVKNPSTWTGAPQYVEHNGTWLRQIIANKQALIQNSLIIEWEDDLRKGRNFPPPGWNSGTPQLTSHTEPLLASLYRAVEPNASIDLISTPRILLSVALLLQNTPDLLPVIALLGIYISRRISGGEVHWIGHRGSQGNYTAVSWSRVKLEKYIIDTFNPNQTVLDQNELCLL